MTAWLRIALAVQLAFFGVWGASLLSSHDDAKVVWLATNPVDPRDLLSGHYVALRYRIGSPIVCETPEGPPKPTVVYVRLETTGELVSTPEGAVEISEAVACQEDLPVPSTGERWIAGQLGAERGREITYGIERFYVPETSALRVAQSGNVVAKVAISDTFEPRIVDLVTLLQPTDQPAE